MGFNPSEKIQAVKGRDEQSDFGFSFTPVRFALLLGLLLIVCFPQVIAGWETFYAVDYGTFGYPIASFHRDSFWSGRPPLWNPYNNCGMPFLAQWNTMTLYPFSLFYLVFPLSWSLGVFCLLHLLLGGLGMFFLARRWTGNPLASALGGAAFAFNGLTWFGLMWPNNISAIGWMPWVVLAMEKAWTLTKTHEQTNYSAAKNLSPARSVILAALAGTMQMLTGAPEVIMLTWLVVGALWLVQFFGPGVPRWQMVRRGLSSVLLVIGLSAAQLLPFLSLLRHSQRGSQFDTSLMLEMPPYGWANYLVPLFHCFYSRQGVLIQPTQGWVGSYYAGIAVVALALFAICRIRNRRVWLLGVLLLFSLTMSLGNHLFIYPAVKKLAPIVGFMRMPIKFVILAAFALPLLAAWGFNHLTTQSNDSQPRDWRFLKKLSIALVAAIVVILLFASKFPLATDNVSGTAVNGVVRAVFLALTLGCIALICRERETSRQRLWQTGLILLLWFDVFTHAPNLSPTVARGVYEPNAIRQFFKWSDQLNPDVSRAMPSTAAIFKILNGSTGNAETDTTGRRLALLMNLNLLDHAAKVDGFYSLDLKEFNDVNRLVDYLTNQTSNLNDFLMVSRVSNPTNDVDWVARNSALPLITAGQKPVFIAPADELKALVDGRFDPRRMVCLPNELHEQVHVDATNAKIDALQYTPQKIQFGVDAAAPAMVVIAQAFYYPWHAYVDGTRVPLWRANHAFQALEVPAGKHEVRLVYEDKVFLAGAIVSLVSLCICAVIWIVAKPKRTANPNA